MKKWISMLMSIGLLLSVSACSASSDNGVANGDPEQFLTAMAEGIKERCASNEDYESMTEEELAAYYEKLVDMELSRLEKFENAVFADAKFNQLAHQYIQACQMQKTGAENYRNAALYDALWSGGRTIRSGIIIYLYENYDLPISSEEVSSYASDGSASYSVSDGDDVLDLFSDDDDVSLAKGDLLIQDASGKIQEHLWESFEYCFVVKNNSEFDLNMIYVECAILDKDENILGTTSAYAWVTVEPDKTVNCESSFDLSDYPEADSLRIESVGYDGDGDHTSHTVEIDETDIAHFTLSIH